MFDFLKKKPLLFTMDVILEPCVSSVLDEGCQMMFLKKDGKAYAGKKYVGQVYKPAWDYIRGFCTPQKMYRKEWNRFQVEVTGEADMSNVFPDPHDKPYIYKCGRVKQYPHMLPNTEYFCELAPVGQHLDIIVAGNKIGELTDKRKDGRIDRINKMINTGYQATAQIDPSPESCGIFVIIRKV